MKVGTTWRIGLRVAVLGVAGMLVGAEPANAEPSAAAEAPPASVGAGDTTPAVAEAAVPPQEEDLPPGTFRIGAILFRPSVEVRERFETRLEPYTATGTGDDDYFVGSRVRLGAELTLDPVRVLVQVQDARNLGQFAVGTDDGATTGLHQGFLEVRACCGWFRLGRQEITYGAQRMIGNFNWSTAGRSFDALRTHWQWGDFGLDAFGAMTRVVRTISYTVTTGDPPVTETRSVRSEGDYLAGLEFSWTLGEPLGLEVTGLYRHDGPTEPPAGATDPAPSVGRDRDIASAGLRLHGTPVTGLSYDVEAAIQGGRAAGARHLAAAAAAELGYMFQVAGRPGFTLGGAYATGGAPGDSWTEFDNFFPTNHPFYGIADLFGWRNLFDGWARLSFAPVEAPVKASLAAHLLGLAEPGSRWANAGGVQLGVDPANTESILGYELDVELLWTPWRWLQLGAGYAVFLPAAGAEALGHGDATHFAYVTAGSQLP
ncbi:MAG: alginate export family protein [Deltaproteobacteria bacterium]|nr:alginate export family protein [Deltaproteobacteria bacterium]